MDNASDENQLREPVRKVLGQPLSTKRTPLERLALLLRNADAVLGRDWRGKDDGTLVRKVVGRPF